MSRLALLALPFAMACGVPASTKLSELDEDQAKSLCEELSGEEYTCETEMGDVTYTFGGDCENSSDDFDYGAKCDPTVGEWRDCMNALEAQVKEDACSTETPDACDWFDDCY
jgi:hypothetical protein